MPATEEMSPAEQRELRDQCTVFLAGHGPLTAAELLAGIPPDTVPDRYGSDGVVAELEIEVGGVQRVELSVGDATCKLEPDQVRNIITALLGR